MPIAARGALRRVGNVPSEHDSSGAGAEGGLVLHEGVQGIEEAGALEVLEEGGGFAAGDAKEAVEICEDSGLRTRTAVAASWRSMAAWVVGALQGEDTDGGGTHVCLGGRRFNIHFASIPAGKESILYLRVRICAAQRS